MTDEEPKLDTTEGKVGIGTTAPKKEEERKTFLQEAKELAERNEATAERIEKALERTEELAGRKLLGGDSEAGQSVEKPKEETPEEYAARVTKGEI